MLHYAAGSRKACDLMVKHSILRPLSEFDAAARANVRVILADIDDTITTDGRLTAAAYAALERLHNAGFLVAPVTGRPAGWCDHIARMWPVAGVIGENGAFYYRYDTETRAMSRVHAQDAKTRAENRRKLARLATEIMAAVPGAAISADQFARDTDLAIDFCEDVPRLPDEAVVRIVNHFEAADAVAKVSSIHVNGWFGNHDKLTMAKRFLRDVAAIDVERQNQTVAYIGDSPNDAPMWAYFENSFGVANVRPFKDRLSAAPRYVTSAEAGAGFAEFAEMFLRED